MGNTLLRVRGPMKASLLDIWQKTSSHPAWGNWKSKPFKPGCHPFYCERCGIIFFSYQAFPGSLCGKCSFTPHNHNWHTTSWESMSASEYYQ